MYDVAVKSNKQCDSENKFLEGSGGERKYVNEFNMWMLIQVRRLRPYIYGDNYYFFLSKGIIIFY